MSVKTTLYLDEDLKSAIEFAAQGQQISQAAAIRGALKLVFLQRDIPAPQAGVFEGGQPIDWNNDDYLQGFGS